MNIQNNFGLSFRHSIYVGHLQCSNDYCDYMHRNGTLRNNTKWASSTPLPFVVDNVPLLGPLLSVRYVILYLCVLLCVMLE